MQIPLCYVSNHVFKELLMDLDDQADRNGVYPTSSLREPFYMQNDGIALRTENRNLKMRVRQQKSANARLQDNKEKEDHIAQSTALEGNAQQELVNFRVCITASEDGTVNDGVELVGLQSLIADLHAEIHGVQQKMATLGNSQRGITNQVQTWLRSATGRAGAEVTSRAVEKTNSIVNESLVEAVWNTEEK